MDEDDDESPGDFMVEAPRMPATHEETGKYSYQNEGGMEGRWPGHG